MQHESNNDNKEMIKKFNFVSKDRVESIEILIAELLVGMTQVLNKVGGSRVVHLPNILKSFIVLKAILKKILLEVIIIKLTIFLVL